MSSRRPARVSTRWRPPTRTYEYNFNLGEHYYRPLTRYLDQRDLARKDVKPPGHQTFAERLAVDPINGVSGRNWVDKDYDAPQRPASMLFDDIFPPRQRSTSRDPGSAPPMSMDDTYMDQPRRFRRPPRLGFSDKMLDTVGLTTPDIERIRNGPRSAAIDEEPFFRKGYENLDYPETLAWEQEIMGARARAKVHLNDIEKEFEEETGVPTLERRWARKSRNLNAVQATVRMRQEVQSTEETEKTSRKSARAVF